MAIANFIGIFNIFVGLMLVASLLFMGAGLVLWWVRLGAWPSYRNDAIDIMKWGVTIMFVLVVLLGIAQLVNRHTAAFMLILGTAIVLAVVFFGVKLFMESRGEEEEH
ncbi:hypothetical protein HY970_02925 [Candidatus Kaiserbacteria bacterium]|nr:hypothetical protein [Candidatus Kaiserbacteria bacterium]